MSDSAGTIGGWQYPPYMRGHMEMCVLNRGCTTDQYPWVRIIAYGNGTASITSGKQAILVSCQLGAVVGMLVGALLYTGLTAVVPLAGFEGLLLLALLVSVTVVVLRLRMPR